MDQRPATTHGQNPIRLNEGFFAARDNLRLYWRAMTPEPEVVRATVAVVHGYGDHSGRYREVLEYLARAGFAAHAFDYRGHGQSDGRRAHCDRFGDYLDDLSVFVDHVRHGSEGKKVFLLAHSLGGLITARWALGRGVDEGVAGIVFSSPFLQLAFEPPRAKLLAGRLADRLVPWLPMSNPLRSEQLTRDPAIRRATDADPLYLHRTTPRWYFQTMAAQQDVMRRAAEMRLPCLLMGGGSDPIASPAGLRQFFARVGSQDKTLKVYEGMLHEILNEVGRDEVYATLRGWLEARL